jgi:hypothetical protein
MDSIWDGANGVTAARLSDKEMQHARSEEVKAGG